MEATRLGKGSLTLKDLAGQSTQNLGGNAKVVSGQASQTTIGQGFQGGLAADTATGRGEDVARQLLKINIHAFLQGHAGNVRGKAKT